MTNEKIDFQSSLDRLARENAELTFAFYGFAALVSGHITDGLSFDTQTLADEYEQLASEAGDRLASVDGTRPTPNVHLQFLADSIRATGRRMPLSVVPDD